MVAVIFYGGQTLSTEDITKENFIQLVKPKLSKWNHLFNLCKIDCGEIKRQLGVWTVARVAP